MSKTEPKHRALILDTTAFIMGYEPSNIKGNQFSVPKVFRELIPDSTSWLRFKVAQDNQLLQVRTPKSNHLEDAKRIATKMGDIIHLSETDLEILALALELKNEGMTPIIVSDDYSIQNIAEKTQIEYIPLSTMGIRYQLEWSLYCPACHKRYPPSSNLTICKVCGNLLKKRAVKKSPAKKRRKGG